MAVAPIKVEHIVRSADGALYQVRYINQARTHADLSPFSLITGVQLNEPRIELPLSELRRVKDPRNQKPPIEGLPSDRPTCQYCGNKLKPICHYQYRPLGSSERGRPHVTKRTFARWDGYYGLFCTHRCAGLFAAASHRAGYRIKR